MKPTKFLRDNLINPMHLRENQARFCENGPSQSFI